MGENFQQEAAATEQHLRTIFGILVLPRETGSFYWVGANSVTYKQSCTYYNKRICFANGYVMDLLTLAEKSASMRSLDVAVMNTDDFAASSFMVTLLTKNHDGALVLPITDDMAPLFNCLKPEHSIEDHPFVRGGVCWPCVGLAEVNRVAFHTISRPPLLTAAIPLKQPNGVAHINHSVVTTAPGLLLN